MSKIIIPFNYLPFEFKNTKIIFNDWNKLIKSTEFTLGSYVKSFEKKFASYTKSKYCISTNNGTDALILALKSLDIKKGDEVITVCNTFYATVGAIVSVGAKPILVDCNDQYQINITDIKKKITRRTKAIIPVHWGGMSPNMFEIIKFCKNKKIKIIEDACMGIGGSYNGKHPGTFGDIGAFSMHPLKSLNVMGDGGMIVTNNVKIYNWALKYRNHGMSDRDHIDFWGVNMRLQPLQAIVANHGLKKINRVITLRNQNAKLLDSFLYNLYPNIILPKRDPMIKETFSLYMIICKKRDQLKKYLLKKGIETKIHYPIPLHLQKASKIYNYKKGDFPNSEKQAKQLLSLPVHQFISKSQIIYMAKTIKEFYNK